MCSDSATSEPENKIVFLIHLVHYFCEWLKLLKIKMLNKQRFIFVVFQWLDI